MALKTLRPRLQVLNASRAATLQTKAGNTERPRGRAWMATRDRVALAHDYRCVDCGCVWTPNRDQIDHDVPLEQGGSNDDANLKTRCDSCHKVKTATEATARAGGYR